MADQIKTEQIEGILAIRELLVMIMPQYLSATKPSLADFSRDYRTIC